MKQAIANILGARFVSQPIDVPVLALHVVFLWEVLMVAASVVVGLSLGGMAVVDLAAPHAGVAALAMGMRDGVWEGHRELDRARGIGR